MTAPLPAEHQVGDRVHVHRHGQRTPGRISSIHRTEPTDGGHGRVVNIWTTSGHSSFITPAGSTR